MRSMKTSFIETAVLLISIFPISGFAASIQWLGDLPGGQYRGIIAYRISADGSTVVGCSNSPYQAFRWTSNDGMKGLGFLPGDNDSASCGVSADGSIVVGRSIVNGNTKAFRWTASSGMTNLGFSWANDISADGSIVVGSSGGQACRWTSGSGVVALGSLAGGSSSTAEAVSAEGSVVVGFGNSSSGQQAFRWSADSGMTGLGFLPGTSESFASDVSANGSVIVGYSGNEAFRWTSAEGMIDLGYLPGGISSDAHGISADGSVVVGFSARNGDSAFYWTQSGGMQSLQDLLTKAGVDLTGCKLGGASDVSADGRTIIGYGSTPNGTKAWIATIPEPATLILFTLGGATILRKRRM